MNAESCFIAGLKRKAGAIKAMGGAMKKIYGILLCCCVVVSGCAVAYEQTQIPGDPDPQIRRFVSTHQLRTGLSPSDVKALLGQDVIIGYEMPDTRNKHYKPFVISNPYRAESYTNGNNAYEIEYYLVGINHSDGEVSDDELTPLVYQDGKLIGWGWGYFKRIKGDE